MDMEGGSMENNHTEGLKIQKILFLAFFAVLFILVARLVRPFFSILLWSSLVYGLTLPLYRRTTTGKAGKECARPWRTVMAAVFSIGSIVLIVIPITLLSTVMIGQVQDLVGVALNLLDRSEAFLRSDAFITLATRLADLSGGLLDLRSVDLTDQIAGFLASYSERIIAIFAGLLRNVTGFVVMLAFSMFVLFFLFLDGKELLLMLIDAIPLRNAYTISFMKKFRDTGKDLAIGYILMAVFQGTMAFLVYWIMKVPAPLPLAILSAIASLIPLVGTGLVWVPIVILRFATDTPGQAFLLLVLCAIFISSLDNFIRPFLLHARIKLHPLLIFISIIGGIDFLGVNGVLLGPILLVLFFTAVDMFGRTYGKARRRAPEDGDLLEPDTGTEPPEPGTT